MTDLDRFVSDMTDLLDERGFTRDRDLLQPWLTDWRGRYTGKAAGLASPTSAEQVAAIVRLCAQHGIGIVPQGGNSGMSGGATPDDTGSSVLLSLRRMNAIRSLDIEAGEVICEAGVVLQTLHEAAAANGLRFPLTLGGKGSATIGGLVSTNAGGTQVLRHGTMRSQVLGLEAVLPDGSVLDVLTPLKKDNRGFDLKQLLIGSEGTLGIVTAATLRLVPQIGQRSVAWVGLESIQQARALMKFCDARAGDRMEGFEVVPRSCLETVLAYEANARPPLPGHHAWNALIEFVAEAGVSHDLTQTTAELLAEASEQGLLSDATIATSEAQAAAFWRLRDAISGAERALGPAMQHDISVPVARMAAFIEAALSEVERAFPGTHAIAFGHLGDGNVHFHVRAPEGAVHGAWEETQGKIVSRFVHDLVTEWKGSISAEHGIGQMKRDELARLGDPAALSVMRAIKQALDPQGLLNPGKLVPLAPAATKT